MSPFIWGFGLKPRLFRVWDVKVSTPPTPTCPAALKSWCLRCRNLAFSHAFKPLTWIWWSLKHFGRARIKIYQNDQTQVYSVWRREDAGVKKSCTGPSPLHSTPLHSTPLLSPLLSSPLLFCLLRFPTWRHIFSSSVIMPTKYKTSRPMHIQKTRKQTIGWICINLRPKGRGRKLVKGNVKT